jgi:hypothetical protein
VKSIDFHSQLNKSPCLSIEKEFLFSNFFQKRAIDKSIEKFLEPWGEPYKGSGFEFITEREILILKLQENIL